MKFLQVAKRYKILKKAIGRGGENFATVARANKRKADAAAKEVERRLARGEEEIDGVEQDKEQELLVDLPLG